MNPDNPNFREDQRPALPREKKLAKKIIKHVKEYINRNELSENTLQEVGAVLQFITTEYNTLVTTYRVQEATKNLKKGD